MAMDFLQEAAAMQEKLVEMRREFHAHPEGSGMEKNTSKRIVEILTQQGIAVRRDVWGYGLTADIVGSLEGKTTALRADMDALNITEMNDVAYRSKNEGLMHACGHDNHIACLLGAAILLNRHREELSGTVRLIFQPCEELSPIGGSKGMIAEGAMTGVDAVFGLHVWPELTSGTVGIRKGALMAASDHFSVVISGKSAHAAKPEQGSDAIVAGAAFVNAVQTILSRQISPMENAVVTIGKFNAGTRYNILAEECVLEGTCRTFSKEVKRKIKGQLREMLDHVCAMYGAVGTLIYEDGYEAVINDSAMCDLAKSCVQKVFGAKGVAEVEKPSMTGEDFSFYLKEAPGCFLWLGCRKEQDPLIPLHNSCFNVDEGILYKGAALLAQLAFASCAG